MAKSINNIVTEGLSGRIGKQIVFSQRNGETIVSKFPVRTKKPTAKQIAQQTKFSSAIAYGKNALQDNSLKVLYTTEAQKRKGVSAYNLAVADFLKAPVIENVDVSAYKGAASGEKITITVTDNFKVTTVKVAIINSDDTPVEQGEATLLEGKWIYSTTATNAALSGDKVVVTATDRPGNKTVKEITL